MMGILEDTLLPTGAPADLAQYRWGVVTQNNPLRVQLDTEANPLPITPDTLERVFVGDRVWCQLYKNKLLILGSSSTVRNALGMVHNSQRVMSGGGQRSHTSTGVAWSRRFITLGGGRSTKFNPNGYFNIDFPPAGTVIPVHGHTSRTSATSTATEIPLTNWDALWYELPLGQAATMDPTKFHIVNYTSDFDVPDNWVFLCIHNGDVETEDYHWHDGQSFDYWRTFSPGAGFTNIPSSLGQYRRANGEVTFRGAWLNSTATALVTVVTMPVNFRPGQTTLFPITSNTTVGMHGQVLTTGEVQMYASAATAAWRPLTACRYMAEN